MSERGIPLSPQAAPSKRQGVPTVAVSPHQLRYYTAASKPSEYLHKATPTDAYVHWGPCAGLLHCRQHSTDYVGTGTQHGFVLKEP
jgi:hypothetical protein